MNEHWSQKENIVALEKSLKVAEARMAIATELQKANVLVGRKTMVAVELIHRSMKTVVVAA